MEPGSRRPRPDGAALAAGARSPAARSAGGIPRWPGTKIGAPKQKGAQIRLWAKRGNSEERAMGTGRGFRSTGWSRMGTCKWNPGKWKHRPKPAVPWWFNFDPHPCWDHVCRKASSFDPGVRGPDIKSYTRRSLKIQLSVSPGRGSPKEKGSLKSAFGLIVTCVPVIFQVKFNGTKKRSRATKHQPRHARCFSQPWILWLGSPSQKTGCVGCEFVDRNVLFRAKHGKDLLVLTHVPRSDTLGRWGWSTA